MAGGPRQLQPRGSREGGRARGRRNSAGAAMHGVVQHYSIILLDEVQHFSSIFVALLCYGVVESQVVTKHVAC